MSPHLLEQKEDEVKQYILATQMLRWQMTNKFYLLHQSKKNSECRSRQSIESPGRLCEGNWADRRARSPQTLRRRKARKRCDPKHVASRTWPRAAASWWDWTGIRPKARKTASTKDWSQFLETKNFLLHEASIFRKDFFEEKVYPSQWKKLRTSGRTSRIILRTYVILLVGQTAVYTACRCRESPE